VSYSDVDFVGLREMWMIQDSLLLRPLLNLQTDQEMEMDLQRQEQSGKILRKVSEWPARVGLQFTWLEPNPVHEFFVLSC
jgi:hypothetical protein